MSKIQNEFYLVEELAEKLRVSNMTIYRYIKAGKIALDVALNGAAT